MRQKIQFTLALVCSILHYTPSFAATAGETYGGVQYALTTYSEPGLPDLDPTAIVGRLGKFQTDSFALEGRFGIGLQDDTLSTFGTDLDLEVDTIVGIYGVQHIKVSDNASLYGLIGVSNVGLTASIDRFGISASEDETDLSYGVGANFGNFNIEYIQYVDTDLFDVSAISFGYISNF